jgi:RNA polymerase sigma-70 factor (ECF subfamily)
MTVLAPDDTALVAAAQAGDERAFQALVAPHRRALEVHLYRMLGSVHDAEDVLQDALLRAWRSLDRFEGRATIHTWLYRIATNACLDELARRPRRPEPLLEPYPDDRLEDLAEPIADPAARYAAREGMELAFLTAVQWLPGRQRAVLVLRDVLGWSAAEAADLLDASVPAVNSALQRARATIERELGVRPVRGARSGEQALLERYVDAWERADMDGLVALLRQDAVLSMPPGPSVSGATAIGAFLARRREARRLVARATAANRQPAVAMWEGEKLHRLVLLDVEGGRIAALHAFTPSPVSRG